MRNMKCNSCKGLILVPSSVRKPLLCPICNVGYLIEFDKEGGEDGR